MGRMIPLDNDPLIHSALPFSLMVAGMVATMAIITGLCGFGRKPAPDSGEKSDSEILPSNAAAETTLVPPAPQEVKTTLETEGKTENSELGIKELPLPPAMRASLSHTYSCNNLMTKSQSTRKLSSALSMKHVRSISVSKVREKKRSKAEDSVWTKTIMLGEKCKISDDGDDDDDDDDDAGGGGGGGGGIKHNEVSAYHPRSMSISRTNSFRKPDIIVNHDNSKQNKISANHPRTMSSMSISRTTSFREPDIIVNRDKDNGMMIMTRK